MKQRALREFGDLGVVHAPKQHGSHAGDFLKSVQDWVNELGKRQATTVARLNGQVVQVDYLTVAEWWN
jgi:hypothetical protein